MFLFIMIIYPFQIEYYVLLWRRHATQNFIALSFCQIVNLYAVFCELSPFLCSFFLLQTKLRKLLVAYLQIFFFFFLQPHLTLICGLPTAMDHFNILPWSRALPAISFDNTLLKKAPQFHLGILCVGVPFLLPVSTHLFSLSLISFVIAYQISF